MTVLKNMRINKSGIVTLLLMATAIVAVSLYFLFRDQSAVQKRNNTPAAQALLVEDSEKSFTNLQGDKVSINENFGKPIVVMSWASWCPQCTNDLQELGKIAQDFSSRGVTVMAVNRAEDKYSAQRYLDTLSLPSELRIVLDPSDYYFGHSEGYAMPETVVFKSDGQVTLHQHGELRSDELRKSLEELVSK